MGAPFSGGPGAIAPVASPLIRPCPQLLLPPILPYRCFGVPGHFRIISNIIRFFYPSQLLKRNGKKYQLLVEVSKQSAL